MAVNKPAVAGFHRRTYYTLPQLQLLRDCLECNKDLSEPLTSSLIAFMSTLESGDSDDVLFWLRFAEQIKKDRDFPEKEFSRKDKPVHFVITPSAP